MPAIVAVICIAVLSAAFLVKRARDRALLDKHSITAEDLHSLLAAKHDVSVYDVRLPLDLLSNSVVIPGAKRLAPEEVMENPSLIPIDRDAIVYCTCPSDETSRAILHRALSLGHMRIKFLRGGLDGWKTRGYPVETYDKPFHLSTGKKNGAAARSQATGNRE